MNFKPALIPGLVTLLVLTLLLSLGFWQLDRARQKEVLQERFAAELRQPAVPVTEVVDPAAARYRQVTAQGRYDAEHQILLDNQVQEGRPGYHVYTPLRLPDQEQAILVNRGWVALGDSREQLPDIAVAEGPVSLRGRLSQPANPGLQLGDPTPDTGWPKVVQYLDYESLASALGYPLAPAVILLSPQAEGGYRRDWQPHFGGFGPDVHRGYAVQWFSLAAALVVIYVVVNARRRRA